MANKRMFSLKVIDTDLFLDMPMTARLLYYDLSMRADDDGFVASPKKIQRMIGCSDDDLRLLILKQFVIPFDSGVCVIRHWRIHNYIRGDRHSDTIYQDEKNQLVENNGTYELSVIPNDNQMSYQMDTQVRLGKVRLGKVSLDKEKNKPPNGYETLINAYTSNENLVNAILDFIKMRKAIKKPLTDRALKLILDKLDTLATSNDDAKIEILNQSIMNSWQGVFPLKSDSKSDKYNKNVQRGNRTCAKISE